MFIERTYCMPSIQLKAQDTALEQVVGYLPG